MENGSGYRGRSRFIVLKARFFKSLDRLGAWTKSNNPDVRYFSWRTFYRTTFTLKDELPSLYFPFLSFCLAA
jgi:hypothetical protein